MKTIKYNFVNVIVNKTIKMTAIKQILKPEIKEKVLASVKIKSRLAYEFDRHVASIERWVEDNNILLTTPMAVNAIAEELSIDPSEVLA